MHNPVKQIPILFHFPVAYIYAFLADWALETVVDMAWQTAQLKEPQATLLPLLRQVTAAQCGYLHCLVF